MAQNLEKSKKNGKRNKLKSNKKRLPNKSLQIGGIKKSRKNRINWGNVSIRGGVKK